MRHAVALALAGLVVAPAAAAARTSLVLEGTGGVPQPYQRWIDQSNVPTPSSRITLHLQLCAGAPDWAVGCAIASEPGIYLDREAQSRRALMHEMGHVFDFDDMSDASREQFTGLVGRRGVPWTGVANTNPLQEKFAEAYSLCARRRTLATVYFALYAYTPTPTQHRRVCALIRRTALAPVGVAPSQIPPVVYIADRPCLAVWRYVDAAPVTRVTVYQRFTALIRMTSWDYRPGARAAAVCGHGA